jgi:hypothetical protein
MLIPDYATKSAIIFAIGALNRDNAQLGIAV